MSFTLSKSVNSSKVFLTRKAEMTGRWDPSYFRPQLVALEKLVRSVTPSRLRDYVRRMAGGATPSTKEAETHYTESENGVPFIRVQNLSTTGKLNLKDCKRITRSTHEGLLGRSKLSGGELLVKITGVGRMAVASVVPDDCEANINQHIVAIRTGDKRISESLAAWLNLDSAERLASRRSTGGTRPALDYPALLSIPVVFDERIPALMQAAVKRHQKQVEKAEALLAATDEVLLGELGIPRKPEPPNTLKSRIFQTPFSELTGQRWDPNYAKQMGRFLSKFKDCKYPVRKLKDFVATVQYGISERATADEVGVPMLRMLNLQDGEWSLDDMKYIAMTDKEKKPYLLNKGDILFNRTNSKELVGKCNVVDFDGEYVFASYLMRVTLKADAELLPEFVVAYVASSVGRIQIDAVSRQIAGMTNINAEEVRELLIPAIDRKSQERVCKSVASIRGQARALRQKARADLENAKRDIEALILGKETSV